jgi:hypothetical protein
MLQPQGASRGCRAEERLGGWTQAQEGDLGCRPRANTPRRPPIGIGQIAAGRLARTDRVVVGHLGTSVTDYHLLFVRTACGAAKPHASTDQRC